MHIEPGVVQGAKLLLGFGTALTAGGLVLRQFREFLVQYGLSTLLGRTICTSLLVFSFFEILPSSPVGVSEVHLILGSTLFLLFGLVPTAFGLAIGLLAQGILLAPWDLPQYGMNVTTLLLPLFLVSAVAERIIQEDRLPGFELWTGPAVVACLPGGNCQLGGFLGLLWPRVWC